MANGAGPAKTSVGSAEEDWINARGHDLGADILGQVSFSGYFHLLMTGEVPNPAQQKMLDMLLAVMADPSLNPAHQAARIACSSNPSSLQLALASGFLAGSPKSTAEIETCAGFLKRLKQEIYEADHSAAHVLKERLKAIKTERGSVPGFTDSASAFDKVSAQLLELADRVSTGRIYPALVRQLHVEVNRIFETREEMKLALAIAAVQLEFGFPVQLIRSLPFLAQAATLLAHMAEENVRPVAPVLLSAGAEAVEYDNRGP